MNTLNVCSRRRTGASDFLAPRREHEGEGEYFIERASPAYLNRVLAPEGEVLSCRDKKVPKEALPRSARILPCVPRPTGRSPNSPGAIQRASGSNTSSLRNSRWGCGTRRALRGLKTPRLGTVSFPTPYGAPEHRQALGVRPEGGAAGMSAPDPRGRMSRRGSTGTQSRGAEVSAPFGVSFLLVTLLWTSKEESPRVQGRSYPPLAFDHRRRRFDTNYFTPHPILLPQGEKGLRFSARSAHNYE